MEIAMKKNILITGTQGGIGSRLTAALATNPRYQVIGLSRRQQTDQKGNFVSLTGDFANEEDLKKLSPYSIDAVVHLAAVTGGCAEGDGILVNVEGTRRLMRYLIDQGCRKFIMASSIAVVGIQSKAFRPLQIPIPDDHPCLDRDGYGFSKYLMEQVTEYYWRQHPEIDVINFRIGGVMLNETPLYKTGPLPEWSLGYICQLPIRDVLSAITLALEAASKPGVRTMNLAGPRIHAEGTVREIFSAWYPDTQYDLTSYDRPGHERDGVFSSQRIHDELGFKFS
jgi:UDP-glucose 4-epimerase